MKYLILLAVLISGSLYGQTGVIKTTAGSIHFELYPDKAPETVKNFIRYIEAKKYEQGSFFRVTTPKNEAERKIQIEVIQGGIAADQNSFDAIALETTQKTGLTHADGALSMARSGPNTAQGSFFICVNAQPELDFGGKRQPDGQGFAVFGKVTKGMEVVRKIQQGHEKQQQLIIPVIIISVNLDLQ